ncbi:MAG: GNAT family N-acetyltransferase [Candidatus Gracilibacteria bacterium]|nr:GNAT family N-acetyltransferase [Candidatus Gracilibacteria bacterium]
MYSDNSPVQILNMLELREQNQSLYETLPGQLHSISAREEALLERSTQHYTTQRNYNQIVIATTRNRVIGSVGMLPVADGICEVSGAWVHSEFRGHGIGGQLHKKLKEVAVSANQILYSTVKPHIPGNFPEVLINIKELGAIPVSFSQLSEKNPEAFRGCCACSERKNHEYCPDRDHTCFLLMQGARREDAEIILNSPGWKNAIDEKGRDTLIHHIDQYIL